MNERTPIAQKLSGLIPSTESIFEPEQFNEIELDEIEIEEGLRKAREEKHFKLKREAYRKKVDEQVEYQKHTAEELFTAFTNVFSVTDEKHAARVKNLCCYFANDNRTSYDLTKGILLMGNIGNGKTTIMKAFSVNQNHGFRVVSMLDVSFDYKMSGEEGVKSYSLNYKASPNQYGLTDYGYCFDELGTEEIPARHYGESKNIFAEILQVRYHHGLPFQSTHVTTNKTPDELQALYGSRCYDRMKEMFNVVVFENESFR